MRVIRSVVSGLLVAAGAYLVGMVGGWLAYELYPWADDMIILVFVTWVAAFFVVGAICGYLSKSRMMGSLVLDDVMAADLYCTTWGRSLESVHCPIEEFWSTYDEQGQYPFAEQGDDA